MYVHVSLSVTFMYDQCRMYKNLYLNSDRIVLLSNEFKEFIYQIVWYKRIL